MEPSREYRELLDKYKSKKEIIEELFIKSLIASYDRVKLIPKINHQNEINIRNDFEHDLVYNNLLIKELLEKNLLTFTCENQIITEEREIKRTDISFIISGCVKFVVECKKIKSPSANQYIHNGIKRFIKMEYITNDEYAGMCSFVVTPDIENIIYRLKGIMIKNKYSEISDNPLFSWETSFYSLHNKVDKSNLVIYHIFFEFSS